MSNEHSYESFKETVALTNTKIEELKKLRNELLEKKRNETKEKLLEEKSKCEEEVSKLKKKLIAAERANGVFQVPLPKATAEVKVVEKPAPQQQPKKAAPQPTDTAQKGDNNAAAKKGGGKKKKAAGGGGGKQQQQAPAEVDISRLDLRIGQIRSVKLHPNAESLYVEQMDVGEPECRNVVTGVVKFVPIDQMENRKVIVLCNLKPSKIRGETSQAMVMCASTPENVEILDVPSDAVPGDRVVVPGFEGEPDGQINPKKKILERILPDLRTDASCNACYKGKPLTVVGKGVCKSKTLKDVQIK